MSVDDAIRSSLERLVQRVEDPDAVVAEVERRAARRRRRRTRLLVAAAVVAVLGVAGAVVGTSDRDSDHVTAGPGALDGEGIEPPTVTVSATGLAPLRVTTSGLAPSEHGWLEHTITLENPGDEAVHLADPRTGEFLGQREVLAVTNGCSWGQGEGEPVGVVCFQDLHLPSIAPGQQYALTITLWRGLDGMNDVTSDTLVFRAPVAFRARGDNPLAEVIGGGEIVLTYEHLDVPATVLPAPSSGAEPQRLDDGTPVWVVRHDDGTVSVLDAAATHTPFGVRTLVGWCPRARLFEEPSNGSVFDEWGRKVAGPAPSGLFVHPVAGNEVLTVTGPPIGQPKAPEGSDRIAEQCLGSRGATEDAGDQAPLQLHSIVDDDGVSVDEALAADDGEVRLVRGASILLEQGEPARVCDTAVWTSAPPACAGPEAPDLSLFDDRQWALLTGDFMARVRDGAMTDIAFVNSYGVQGPGDG